LECYIEFGMPSESFTKPIVCDKTGLNGWPSRFGHRCAVSSRR
jgi:hypothetical protein